MKDGLNLARGIFAFTGGCAGYFLGGMDGLLYALILFITADYITGVMCAAVEKQLSSEVGFKGIFKKVMIFVLVGAGHILDTHVLSAGSAVRSAVICFFLSNEGVSLLENAYNAPPQQIANTLNGYFVFINR